MKIEMKISTQIAEEYIPSKNPDVVVREETDDIMILSHKEKVFPIVLNKISSRIFSLCDGKRKVKDIIAIILEEFISNDSNTVKEDVKSCIARLLFLKFIVCKVSVKVS